MLVSWEWLSEYVKLDVEPDELAMRFAMSGLNHEATNRLDHDTVIDLEVTSNRGDCLGHIGVAREASVLLNRPLRIPQPTIPQEHLLDESIQTFISIENRFLEACPRYMGRVIRGVKVGPSPEWLQRRLAAIGVKSINNVVDVTNYVMFEVGHPLHAFDLAKISERKVIVRRAEPGEKLIAIDHRTYELDPSMVVIADARRAMALGGIMGGADTEVSSTTTDLLIESATFTPLTIRRTSRQLRLQSPSSFRFERRVDAAGLPWACARCCQLILEVAGGQCTSDSVDAGSQLSPIPPIRLRRDRIAQVTGIEIPWEQSVDILRTLGCTPRPPGDSSGPASVMITPPSFRGDLAREIDLIEEIARIYGYENIPEDVAVPTFVSSKREKDVLLERVRAVAAATGFDEALTPSVVNLQASQLFAFWSSQPPLQTKIPLLEGATYLRRSLVSSLIQAYQYNQSQQQRDAALFETAVVYLPARSSDALPEEQFTLGWATPDDLRVSFGMIEEMIERVAGLQRSRRLKKGFEPLACSELHEGSGLWVTIEGQRVAWSGMLSRSLRETLKIEADLSVGEIHLDRLSKYLGLIPTLDPIPAFPAIHRDLNLIVDESLRWEQIEQTVRRSAGDLLAECSYRETYRDTKKDGAGKKRILLTLVLQSRQQTLTSEQADAAVGNVIQAAAETLDAKLLA